MNEILAVCGALIIFDIVCGITAAAKENALSSQIMREGMYNKFGEIMLLIFAMFWYFILEIPPFDQIGIPPEVMYSITVYIAGMEVLSIIENICRINPNLPIAKILLMFNIDVNESDENA